MKFIFTYIILILILTVSCSKQEAKYNNRNKTDSLRAFNLSENQKKVLAGAKKCLEIKFLYDMDMAYYVLKYRDGELIGTKVYPNGDLDPALGVCTDVTIRALRWGGVCDLQEKIHEDIKANWNDYPMSRWSAKKPDSNIDHRRVPNQLVWLKKNWQEITDAKYEPGDIVVWDMNGDSWSDHIGIISDVPLHSGEGWGGALIHVFPFPGYVAEEDVLNKWEITGVFRVKD